MAYGEQDVPDTDEDDVSDAGSSVAPGGPGQIEQEPGRGRRLGHDPRPRRDIEVRNEIERRLADSDEIDDSDIEFIVSEGVVTLLGTVPDYETKRMVEALCDHTAGVREIRDQLRVSAHAVSPGGLRTTAPRAGFRGPER